ncbi:MAG: EAL domain-containing protein [Gammaproteobacteria bacterium]|nr:EAL domain-containing protein [Gammaproteobacteria bacterium]
MKGVSTNATGWVLVVEPSATLRHALQRLGNEAKYPFFVVTSYEAGLAELKEPKSGAPPIAALIGYPSQLTTASDELLAALRQPQHLATAVILLTHAATTETFDWVARRPGSAMLLWDDYSGCLTTLERLLTPNPSPVAVSDAVDDIRVLFVDDARTVRTAYQRLLVRHGYMVEVATNITDAMELALARSFDIAIVDYHMPGGNGDVLCRQLRHDPRTVGITTAILTGSYLDQVIRDSLDAGAIECMFKVESDELFLTRLAAMSRAIRAKKSIDAERQRLAGILASVGDGVYGVNRAGQVTFINPAASAILGLSDINSIIGRLAHKLFHYATEDGRANPADTCFLQQAYVSGDELREWETVFWNRAGDAVPVECTVYPLRVEGRLEGSVVAFRDVSERKQLERELVWQANHDTLTHLYNRNFFERALEAEVSRLKRSRELTALLYIDLDRFKYINDTAGHAAGDRLLCEISARLKSRLRDSDTLARLGGDEFAIILRNVSEESVRTAADGFREILEEFSFVYNSKSYNVNGSIGVALIDRNALSPGEVLANADIACHIAKSRGRNQTHVYRSCDDERGSMGLELGWSARLQDALKSDRFQLMYQPIVAVDAVGAGAMPVEQGRLWDQLEAVALRAAGHYEVLVRLLDHGGALISPGAFLPTAERFGLMPQIDAWILTNAVRQLTALHARGRAATFTINLSGQTMDAAQLVPLLKQLLDRHPIDSRYLIFEITETSAIANIEAAKRLINELRDIGCRFALDDFGSGFSSFYHLKHLPVDFIKIDGQFVQGMHSDPIDRAIVGSINDIAHSFGKRTVAEFVESRDILGMLQTVGVDFAQGYYIASPRADIGPRVVSSVLAR